MITTIAVIAEKKKRSAIAVIIGIIWQPLSSNRSDHSDNDRWYRTFSIAAIVVTSIAATATIPGKWFPYDHCDHCNCWTFFFSAMAAIVAIIWKPGLGSKRVTKCDVTKIQICDIMELIGIFRKNKVKNADLQEISVLVQIRWWDI